MESNTKKYIAITILMICSVIFKYSYAEAAASFNYGQQDPSTLQVSNYSANPSCNTCWYHSISASAGQIISFMVYYHNTGTDTANNTTLQVNLPGGSFNSTSISGSVSAVNASGASGSVNVYISTSQSLTFIPGSLKWYPNQSSGAQSAPSGQSGSEIISGGLNIGNITGGWPSQGYAVFQAQISSNAAPTPTPTPTPTPSPTPNPYPYPTYYSYDQTYYPQSAASVYVPVYTPPPTYTPPAPVYQPNPFQIIPPASKPKPAVQRGEEKLEFKIYLDKEKAQVGDEDILFARYYNSGESPAKNATLYVDIPDGVEFLKFTVTPALMQNKNLFVYNIGTINPGEEKIVSLNFLVAASVIPGDNLPFGGRLEFAGSRGTLKSIQDSTTLNVVAGNPLTASLYSIFGPILNSWFREILFGGILGFFLYHFFFAKKEEPVKFKEREK